MLIDLSGVARSLREDTFAAALVRLRDEIRRQLQETGAYKIQEGGREFTITVPRPPEGGGPGERSPR